MTNTLMLLAAVAFCAMQNVVKKQFHQRCAGGELAFSAMTSGFAMLFFLVMLRELAIPPKVILFSLAFALSYGASVVFSLFAIESGSLAQTTLITSYSLLIPTFYGIVFLREKAGIQTAAGLLLLVVSLYLSYYRKTDKKPGKKWLIFVLLAFLGNGLCSTFQKMEQLCCGKAHGNIFMSAALVVCAVMLSALSLLSDGGEKTVETARKSWPLAALCGIMNGAVNLLVMLLNERLAVSILFPVISAGSVIIVFAISVFFYRERFSAKQLIGFFSGVAAVVTLNL